MALINIQGQKFGSLTVIERLPYDRERRASQWKCLCDCGNYTTATGSALRHGDKKSCGCANRKLEPGLRQCAYCGKPMSRNKRFCSHTCQALAECGAAAVKVIDPNVDQGFPWKTFGGKWVCRYQSFVSCTDRDCKHCGWNPEVAEARLQKFLNREKEAAV